MSLVSAFKAAMAQAQHHPNKLPAHQIGMSGNVNLKNIASVCKQSIQSRMGNKNACMRKATSGMVHLKNINKSLKARQLAKHIKAGLSQRNQNKPVTVKHFLDQPPMGLPLNGINQIARYAMHSIENKFVPEGCFCRARFIADKASLSLVNAK